MPKQANPAVELERIREERAKALTERDTIERMPRTTTEIHEDVDLWVETQAARWKPNTSGLVMPGGNPHEFDLAPVVLRGEVGYERVVANERAAHNIVLAKFFPDVIKTELRRLVDAQVEELGGGISAKDRTARLEEIDAELYRLEVREERLIREAALIGVHLIRRADAPPAVVLGDLGQDAAA